MVNVAISSKSWNITGNDFLSGFRIRDSNPGSLPEKPAAEMCFRIYPELLSELLNVRLLELVDFWGLLTPIIDRQRSSR